MPDVSLPTNLIVGPIKAWLEKFFLFDTYLTSQKSYLNRSGFLCHWENLGYGVTYSLALPSILDSDRSPQVQIALKVAQGKSVKELVILVEADSWLGIYQEAKTVYGLSEKPLIITLPSIPLRSIHLSDSRDVFQSYSRIRVKLVSVEGTAIKLEGSDIDAFQRKRSTISNSDLLNDRFVERWGTFWNLGAVDFAIKEQANWFSLQLVIPKVLYLTYDAAPWHARIECTLKYWVGRPLCWCLTRPFLLKVYFWLPIFLKLRKFKIENS